MIDTALGIVFGLLIYDNLACILNFCSSAFNTLLICGLITGGIIMLITAISRYKWTDED